MTVGMGRINQGAGATAAIELPEIGGGVDAGIGEGNDKGFATLKGINGEGTCRIKTSE